jgi:hypothetical protein
LLVSQSGLETHFNIFGLCQSPEHVL